MKTYVIEVTATALSSICHNAGEVNGNIMQLRRERFVSDGVPIDVPVISGNALRGKLRDVAASELLTGETGEKIKVDADTFNLLFSGGSLESVGNSALNINTVRKLRQDIPLLSLFGCSIGNIILPGKLDIGKMIPICKETKNFIPSRFFKGDEATIWNYCQVEMYTRKDDVKDENKREFICESELEQAKGMQMIYHIETIAAGTRFYWRICLRDTTDTETGVFLNLLNSWGQQSAQVGGNARVGHGIMKIEVSDTHVIDSDIDFKDDDFVRYSEIANTSKIDMRAYLEEHKNIMYG